MFELHVKEDQILLSFLQNCLPAVSRAELKRRLKYGAVLVDKVAVSRHDFSLRQGQIVEFLRVGEKGGKNPAGIRLLKQTPDFVVIEKPIGLLTVASAKEKERTALVKTQELLKGHGKLHACHRLDRETSGILLLARNKKVQQYFFDHWKEVSKTYLVVVEGRVEKEAGTIANRLWENPQTLDVHVTDNIDAKDAISHFRVKERTHMRTLLEVDLETGRKHQIRVHMAYLGHPVVGDPRYSELKKLGGRLALHAHRLTFVPPDEEDPTKKSTERLVFESPLPNEMRRLMGSKKAENEGETENESQEGELIDDKKEAPEGSSTVEANSAPLRRGPKPKDKAHKGRHKHKKTKTPKSKKGKSKGKNKSKPLKSR
ncbi:MAG: RNA pseudouridine synthase [Deltaproteobacteria bacterium]|nr:RNA pseudouridine synthase [Deltaproteobacteria bacterium]